MLSWRLPAEHDGTGIDDISLDSRDESRLSLLSILKVWPGVDVGVRRGIRRFASSVQISLLVDFVFRDPYLSVHVPRAHETLPHALEDTTG